MFEKRTDLALESHEIKSKNTSCNGVFVNKRDFSGIEITEVTIQTPEGELALGKPMGKYVTLHVGNLWDRDAVFFSDAVSALSLELCSMIPAHAFSNGILVAGLGNSSVTPDSVGPRVVENLIVTHHLKTERRELFLDSGFGNVAAISPGVLGQTGVESAHVIKGVCDAITPSAVVAVDALASRRLSRLATTVQLSDTGITPGSGVSNHRNEISKRSLGVPVISIGVPTVVDAATLAHDLMEESLGTENSAAEECVDKALGDAGRNLFISPRDIDVIVHSVSKLISYSLNMAFHSMTVNELNEFLF